MYRNNLKEVIELTRDLLGVSEKPSSVGPAPHKSTGKLSSLSGSLAAGKEQARDALPILASR